MSGAARVAVAVALLFGCARGTGSGPGATSTSAESPSTNVSVPPEGWEACTNLVEGFTVHHPGDWYTTDIVFGVRDRSRACTYFDREPFDPAVGAEPNDQGLTFPIHIYTQGSDAETIVGTRGVEVVSQEQLTVAGLSAIRLETVLTAPLLGEPEGRYYRYLVDTPDGRQFTFITADHVDPAGYEENKVVLDQLVRTLTFL